MCCEGAIGEPVRLAQPPGTSKARSAIRITGSCMRHHGTSTVSGTALGLNGLPVPCVRDEDAIATRRRRSAEGPCANSEDWAVDYCGVGGLDQLTCCTAMPFERPFRAT